MNDTKNQENPGVECVKLMSNIVDGVVEIMDAPKNIARAKLDVERISLMEFLIEYLCPKKDKHASGMREMMEKELEEMKAENQKKIDAL